MDGLTLSSVRQLLKAKEDYSENFITLTGSSGRIWGVVRIYKTIFTITILLTGPFARTSFTHILVCHMIQ